jgi:hypothetical protein
VKRIALLVLAFMPVSALALGPDKACFRRGGEPGDICAVSLSTLIARGKDFDGKNVSVKGYYAYAEKAVLFVSRDAFSISDAAAGVVVIMPANEALAQKLAGVDHQYVQIVGRYYARAFELAGNGGIRSGGFLTEITSVGATGDRPWGYSLPVPPELNTRSP